MDELREKAKKSIVMKKPVPVAGESNPTCAPHPHHTDIGQNGANGDSTNDQTMKENEGVENSKNGVSEMLKKSNDSLSSENSESQRKRSRSRSHKKSSKHRTSRHKSRKRSSSRRRHRRRRSSVSSSSRSRDSSDDRRRRRRRDQKRRRRSSSSYSSRDRYRHRRSKHSRRHRRHSRSSSGSNSNDSRRPRKSTISDKKSHPYFSRQSKVRRNRLNQEKKERFWDGFQWVSKESIELASKDPTADLKGKDHNEVKELHEEKIVTGKDLKRIVATNLPLDYGVDHEDLGNFIKAQCLEKGDSVLFKSIFLNTEVNSGILECTEKEMTDLVVKLDGMKLLGHTLRFTKVADEKKGYLHGGDSENLMQESAQLTAQAAAIVSSRLRNLQGKESGTNLNLQNDSFSTTKASKIIKLSNVGDRYTEMTVQMFEELYEDMEEEMIRFGQPKMIKIIRNGEQIIGGRFKRCFRGVWDALMALKWVVLGE